MPRRRTAGRPRPLLSSILWKLQGIKAFNGAVSKYLLKVAT